VRICVLLAPLKMRAIFAITVRALIWESGCVARQIAAVAPTEEKYDGESNGNYSSGYHD
jgi:hypothetical protein